jgi:putative transposase
VWSFDDVDLASLNPTMVVVAREPDGRWYVTFAVDTEMPEPEPGTGREIGIDLGVKDFAVTSEGQRIANP